MINLSFGIKSKVEEMELNHGAPLKYDCLCISGMLPEALETRGKCVPRQVRSCWSAAWMQTLLACVKRSALSVGWKRHASGSRLRESAERPGRGAGRESPDRGRM